MKLPSRRGRPRTTIGKIIRAWPWIRLGLRLMRFTIRLRRTIVAAVVSFLGAALFAAIRRRRKGRHGSASVPPAPSSGWGGGTRESGFSTGSETQTEQRLEGVKENAPGSARVTGRTSGQMSRGAERDRLQS